MKETVYARIGRQEFMLDHDAFGTLRSYFDDIRTRLPEGDTETMEDIEARMAELLREQVGHDNVRVVTLAIVRAAMLRLGSPADFGERRTGPAPGTGPDAGRRRLRRSRTDRAIAGVCGGLAAFFGINSTLVRIIMLLFLLSGGLAFWIYIIFWIAVPEDPTTIEQP